MSKLTLDEVLTVLQQDGSLEGDLPSRERTLTLPWFVRTLLTGAAWLTAILLIAAVAGLIFAGAGESAMLPVGLLCAVGGIILMRMRDMPFFVEQLSVPFVLAGGGLIIGGLMEATRSWGDKDVAVTTLIVAPTLYVAGRGMALRLVGAAVACAAFYWITMPRWDSYEATSLSHMLWVGHLRNLSIGAGVWALWRFDDELRARRLHEWLFPLTVVLTLNWVAIAVGEDFFVRMAWMDWGDVDRQSHLYIHEAIMALPLLLWLGERLQARDFVLADIVPLFLIIPVAVMSGILAVGYALLLFGMERGRRSLLCFGVAVSVGGFGWFYYNLIWPLWIKSMVLMLAGGLLLAVGWHRHRATKEHA